MVGVGEPAPSIELADQYGEPIVMERFFGRILCIYFFPSIHLYKCGTMLKWLHQFCTEQAVGFEIDIVAVSADVAHMQKRFDEKHDLQIRFISDPARAVSAAFGVLESQSNRGRPYHDVTPTLYLVDRQGRIAASWHDVKPDGYHGSSGLDWSLAAACGAIDSVNGCHHDAPVVAAEPEAV